MIMMQPPTEQSTRRRETHEPNGNYHRKNTGRIENFLEKIIQKIHSNQKDKNHSFSAEKFGFPIDFRVSDNSTFSTNRSDHESRKEKPTCSVSMVIGCWHNRSNRSSMALFTPRYPDPRMPSTSTDEGRQIFERTKHGSRGGKRYKKENEKDKEYEYEMRRQRLNLRRRRGRRRRSSRRSRRRINEKTQKKRKPTLHNAKGPSHVILHSIR